MKTTLAHQRLASRVLGQIEDEIDVTCQDFSPSTVEAGSEQELTVDARVRNLTANAIEIRWGITLDGNLVQPLSTVTVPVPSRREEFIEPSKTVTIPADRLPEGGGSVEVGIRESHITRTPLGRIRVDQTVTCGTLSVAAERSAPPRTEPPPDPWTQDNISVPPSIQVGRTLTVSAQMTAQVDDPPTEFTLFAQPAGGGQSVEVASEDVSQVVEGRRVTPNDGDAVQLNVDVDVSQLDTGSWVFFFQDGAGNTFPRSTSVRVQPPEEPTAPTPTPTPTPRQAISGLPPIALAAGGGFLALLFLIAVIA